MSCSIHPSNTEVNISGKVRSVTPATAAADSTSRGRPRDEERTAAILEATHDCIKDKGWADRMAKMWGGESAYAEARKVLRDELRELGFEI